jgi:hypothetical protein
MKKLVSLIVLTVILSVAFTGVVFAAQGGMPGAHGVDGETFGGLVSDLAQEDPAALVEHITGCYTEADAEAMGMPGAHGLTGAEFGAAVSALAQMDPGALADHVSGNAQGKPAAHGVSGYAFGQWVRSMAPISDHVRR